MRRLGILFFAVLVVTAGAALVAGPSGMLPEWLTGSEVVDASGTRGILEGWVREVDFEHRVVRVTRGLLPLAATEVAVGAETDIRVQDKIGSLEDLREGVHVRICYDVRDGGRSALSVDVPPSGASCRVATAVSTEPGRSEESVPAASVSPVVEEPPAPARIDAPSPTAATDTPVTEVKAARTDRKRSARISPKRAPAPRASVAPAPQPSAAPRAHAAREEPAVTRALPSTPRETDGHDYEAVIDRVLRR